MKRLREWGKRSAAILTALFLCVGLLQTAAFAAYDEDGVWRETVDETGKPVYDPSGLNKETGEWVAPSGDKWQQILLDWNDAYGKQDDENGKWLINAENLKLDPDTGAPIHGNPANGVQDVSYISGAKGNNDDLKNPAYSAIAQDTNGDYYFATFTVTNEALENALKELEKDKACEVCGKEDGSHECPECHKSTDETHNCGEPDCPTNAGGEDGGDNTPENPGTPATPNFGFDFGDTTIEDPEVPLAGLFTRADAIGYLWQQAGEPEAELFDFPDVDADHQWAVAIGWAQDMGIARPDLEGNFRPDDLVERFVEDAKRKPEGELEEFLNRYAVYAGIELAEDELFYVLGGQADDIIMGEEAQVIFDDFFAKLEAALAQAA